VRAGEQRGVTDIFVAAYCRNPDGNLIEASSYK
jgi:hypothetical protein